MGPLDHLEVLASYQCHLDGLEGELLGLLLEYVEFLQVLDSEF